MVDSLNDWLNGWQDLDAGRASSNKSNLAVSQIEGFIPLGCVHLGTFESLDTWNLGPIPFVQETCSPHDNVGVVNQSLPQSVC